MISVNSTVSWRSNFGEAQPRRAGVGAEPRDQGAWKQSAEHGLYILGASPIAVLRRHPGFFDLIGFASTKDGH